MNIFLIFNFSANLAIIFDFADESIVFHEYAGAYSRPAWRTGTTDQRTFTRVNVKSRVDQAGMPSIFDEP